MALHYLPATFLEDEILLSFVGKNYSSRKITRQNDFYFKIVKSVLINIINDSPFILVSFDEWTYFSFSFTDIVIFTIYDIYPISLSTPYFFDRTAGSLSEQYRKFFLMIFILSRIK
jgi:hypothetical protein